MCKDRIVEITERHDREPGALVQVLQDVNDAFNYLPEEAMKLVAQGLDVPLSKVYSVATFYKAFSLEPRGRNVIKVCLGTACHIRGGTIITEEFERALGIREGQTTEDREYTLETVRCLGACAMAPLVVVNDKYHGNVSPDGVKKLVKS